MKSRDAEVLAAMARHQEQHGCMPTMKELCFAVGIHRGQLYRNLLRLVSNDKLRELPVGTLRYQLPDLPVEPHG